MGILFLITLVIFKILFFKENLVVIFRTVFALFWLFILPGFALMYYWHKKLTFLERLIIGSCLSIAIIGVIGYNLGLLGLHIKYHGIVLPIICFVISFFIIKKKN